MSDDLLVVVAAVVDLHKKVASLEAKIALHAVNAQEATKQREALEGRHMRSVWAAGGARTSGGAEAGCENPHAHGVPSGGGCAPRPSGDVLSFGRGLLPGDRVKHVRFNKLGTVVARPVNERALNPRTDERLYYVVLDGDEKAIGTYRANLDKV